MQESDEVDVVEKGPLREDGLVPVASVDEGEEETKRRQTSCLSCRQFHLSPEEEHLERVNRI